MRLGVDAGYKHVGLSAATETAELFASEVDVTDLLSARLALRRSRRSRKSNQAPYEVKGFRLFDKVSCKGEEAFIFGRRSSGYLDIRKLDGTRISAGISCKKPRLLERRRTYLTEIRKEAALPPLHEYKGFRAEFL